MAYLVDYYCYKPDDYYRVEYKDLMDYYKGIARKAREDGDEEGADVLEKNVNFQEKIYSKSGLTMSGTYLPRNINPVYCGANPKMDLDASREECNVCIFGAVEGLLKKTGLQARDIDIVVTTCSLYCPTPSMASMLVNRFKMKSTIQAYHLGGMGCSNGVVAVNFVRDILKARPKSNAILVTTETTTPAFYPGKDRSRIISNIIFRMGAAAMLMSNKKSWGDRIKYKLKHSTRTHVGANESGFRCIWNGPDDEGIVGTSLSKHVVDESGKALTKALTETAPLVMSWKQVAEYLLHESLRRMGAQGKAYKPKFADCLQHFLIHAGGAKILDGLGKELDLDEYLMRPNYAVLRDYGNISSSTTWYSLSWLESCRGIRRGDKVLQVGVGSGVKCGVAVWEAVRDIADVHDAWAHHEEALAPGAGMLTGAHGMHHLAYKAIFMALMVLLGAVLYHFARVQPLQL